MNNASMCRKCRICAAEVTDTVSHQSLQLSAPLMKAINDFLDESKCKVPEKNPKRDLQARKSSISDKIQKDQIQAFSNEVPVSV